MGGAQQAQDEQGHTAGDAINAYHIAATAEHARQELDMEKQKQEINKGNYVLGGITKASTMAGPLQKTYLKQFSDQWQKMDPNADTSGLQSIVNSPEDLQHYLDAAGTMLKTGGVQNPDQAAYIAKMGSAEGATALMNDHAKYQAEVLAGQARAAAMNGRNETMQDNAVSTAVNKLHESVAPIRNNAYQLDRALGNLEPRPSQKDPTKMQLPSWIEGNIALQDINSSMMGNKGGSDTSRAELQSPSGKKELGNIMAGIQSNPNQPMNQATYDFIKGLGARLQGHLNNQAASTIQAHMTGIDGNTYHNPQLAPTLNKVANIYKTGQWRTLGLDGVPGGGANSASAAPQPAAALTQQAATPPPPVSYGATPKDIDDNYDKFLAKEAHKTAGGTD